jgi:molybdate transport system substrate-binding protein
LSSDRRASATDLHVIAAGAFEHLLDALAQPFRQESGHVLRVSITNAGGVIRKLELDEPADVVLTSAAGIDALAAKGRLDAATKVEVGRMRLGVAVSPSGTAPDLATADTLRVALLAAPGLAYIDPKGGGTTGPYFVTLFERLGMASEIAQKGILCATGKDVVRAVASGRATIGLTQASELIGVEGVRFAGHLPADLQLISVYCAAVASRAASPGAARDFIRFVINPAGAARFRALGWDVGSASE